MSDEHTPEPGRIDELKREMAQLCADEKAQVDLAAPPPPPEGVSGRDAVAALYNGEDGDAYLFARLNAGAWVYDYALERWYCYRNHTWQLDEVGQAIAQVQGVIDLYLQASSEQTDLAREARKKGEGGLEKHYEELAKKLMERARKLQGLARKKKVLELARSGDGTLGIDGKQWDTDPWVLGCPNGVIDLKTGELRSGRPDDYIKTVCPTPYLGPDTPCPAWEKFLAEVFGGDEDLVGYVRRLFGYSILGLCVEHVFPVLQGQGRNGKGTMLETLRAVLGPLAGPIDAEMLLDQYQHRSAAQPSPDIVDLRGKRLVWASETDEGRKLSLSRIKWLTGGDTLKGRPPNGKVMIEFVPTHTLVLLTNPLPHAPGDDYALWERIRIIHFPYSFVDEPRTEHERPKDKFLPDALRAEASGILSWLVRGCLEWQREGLGTADAITAETRKYQGEEDLVGQFLADRTLADPGGQVSAAGLYAEYRKWCLTSGLPVKSSTWFGKQLRKRPEIDSVKSGVVYYLGLVLVSDRDEPGQDHIPEG